MNPLAVKAALCVLVAAAVFGSGVSIGARWEQGKQAMEQQHIQQAVEAANQSTAKAISEIKVVNTTIQNEVQREIRTRTVYAECRHTADGLRLLNQAITGAEPAGGGKLSTTDAAGR